MLETDQNRVVHLETALLGMLRSRHYGFPQMAATLGCLVLDHPAIEASGGPCFCSIEPDGKRMASLIAAAPDLLKAAETVWDSVPEYGANWRPYIAALNELRAAIAKAKGSA